MGAIPPIPSQGSLSCALLHNAGWPTYSRCCRCVALLLQQMRHTELPGNAAACARDNGVLHPQSDSACLLRDQAKSSGSDHLSVQGQTAWTFQVHALTASMRLGLPVINAEVAWTAQSSGQQPVTLSVISQAVQASPFHLSATSP